MGAAKRKRELEKALKQMHDDGQGVWQISIIPRTDVPNLIAAAILGDDAASRMCGLLSNAVNQLPLQHPLCLLCDYEFPIGKMPAAFCLLTAKCDDVKQAIVNGLCSTCICYDDLQTRVAIKYRDNMMPDPRVIPSPKQPPGHA